MRFKVETITPERARKMLDRTEALGFTQRSLVKMRVERLAHAIVTGQWMVTHQGIALGPDGAVLDGQHRLAAIVLADQAVDVLVVRETSEEAFAVLDTGVARTTADTLKIAGYHDQNHVAAIARGTLAYLDVMGTTRSYAKAIRVLTSADVLGFLDDSSNQDLVLGANQESRRIAGQLARYGLTSSIGVSMAVVRLTKGHELGSATVAEFYARLGDGAMLEPSSPVMALRRWFMSDTGYARSPGQFRREITVSYILKMLNAYALRKPVFSIRFNRGSEPYPVPLPRGSMEAHERELAEVEEAAEG
jgi:hypothetical protein